MNGGYPDLRRMSPETHERFQNIVYDGERDVLGMAGFSDILTKKQVDLIHGYLIKISHEAYQEQDKKSE